MEQRLLLITQSIDSRTFFNKKKSSPRRDVDHPQGESNPRHIDNFEVHFK